MTSKIRQVFLQLIWAKTLIFCPINSRLNKLVNKCISLVLLLTFTSFYSVSPFGYAAIDDIVNGASTETGDVSFNKIGDKTLEIAASDRSIINFDFFSIGADETVRFIQPFDSASVLGRVTGSSSSDIFGSLLANGQFILVNPNGIYFAETANIQVGSLIASTLDIQSQFFLSGQLTFEKAAGFDPASILNEADIAVRDGGHIGFISEQIENRGTLTAHMGSVALAAGEKVTVSFDSGGMISMVIDRGLAEAIRDDQGNLIPAVNNLGTISADGGSILLTAKTLSETLDLLINNSGMIEASEAVVNQNGSVTFASGRVDLVSNGRIDNQGIIRTNLLDEHGYTFNNTGALTGGEVYLDNIDGAASISGTIGSNVSDTGDINVTGDITLTASVTFAADSDNSGGGDFNQLDNTSSINGNGNNLIIRSGSSDTTGTGNVNFGNISNVNNLKITARGGAITQTNGTTVSAKVVSMLAGGSIALMGNITALGDPGDPGSPDPDGCGPLEEIPSTPPTPGNMTLTADSDANGNGLISMGAGMILATGNGGSISLSASQDSNIRGINVSAGGNFNLLSSDSNPVTFTANNALTSVGGSLNIGNNVTLDLNGQALTVNTESNNGTLRLNGDESVNITNHDINSGGWEYVGSGVYGSLVFGNYYDLRMTGSGSFTSTSVLNIGNSFTQSSGTFTASQNMDVNGAFTTSGGTFNAPSSLTIGADTNLTGGTFNAGSGTVTLDGSGSLTAGGNTLNHLISTGTVNTQDQLNLNGNFTQSSGTFTASQNMDVNGAFTTSGGTFNAPAQLNVAGDFNHTAGTFNHNNGGVVLDGASQSISGDTTFYDLTKTVIVSDTLTVEAGSAQTVLNNLTLQGANAGSRLALRSSFAGTQWSIDPQNVSGRTVDFVDAQDSSNVDATNIDPTNSIDSGNNTGWFSAVQPPNPNPDPNPDPDPNPLPDPDPIPDPNPDPLPDPNPEPAPEPVEETAASSEKEPAPSENAADPCLESSDDTRNQKTNCSVSYVFVDEGAVDVNGNMVYPGEYIAVGPDGRANLHMRALYVTNVDGIKVFRAKIHEPLKDLKLEETPSAIASLEKGDSVYTLLPKTQRISSVDTKSISVQSDIQGLEEGASDIVLSPDGTTGYVANSLTDSIQVIDLTTKTTLQTFRTGSDPVQMVLTKDGKFLFVTNRLDQTVSKIDAKTGEEIAVFQAGESPYGLALSGDDQELFVADAKNDEILIFGTGILMRQYGINADIVSLEGADAGTEPVGTLTVPDTSAYVMRARIKVGSAPHMIKVDEQGKRLFVSNRGSHTLSIIDMATKEMMAEVSVGQRPSGVTITPEGDKAYVANELSGTISLVDLVTQKVMETIPAGVGPTQVVINSPSRPARK